jgi:hypothetical protein
MLKIFCLLAGVAAAASVSSPVYQKLKKPCAKDLAARCVKMTGPQAVACLDAKKDALSKTCRDAMTPLVLQKAKADKQKGNNECTAPFAKVCPDAKPGVALYLCLKKHDAELPPACRVTRKAKK